ncbi:hypothetical protein AB0D97_05020 [Streptomyces roseus]|uniref:hypothetical protein n=1 Tax=Streptomyces roseus TaxID=66430 RepID=UPI0033CAB705
MSSSKPMEQPPEREPGKSSPGSSEPNSTSSGVEEEELLEWNPHPEEPDLAPLDPKPNESDVSPNGLSTTIWDPTAEALNPAAVDEIRKLFQNLQPQIRYIEHHIEEMYRNGELIRKEFEGEVPDNWLQSAGSPLRNAQVAAAYTALAIEGKRCTRQNGTTYYRLRSNNRVCCSHKPNRHCQPPGS